MPIIKTTHFSSNPVSDSKEKTSKYVNDLSSQVLEQLKQKYPNESDYKIAEIALTACAALIEAHFNEKARFGRLPTG